MDAWFLVDPLDLELVADGIKNGINMAYNGPRDKPRTIPNLGSARRHPQATLRLIEKSMQRGFVTGWFPDPPFDNLMVNPVGVVEKPGANPPFRLIEDFSQPQEESINDWTDDMVLRYQAIDEAFQHFARHGKGCISIVFDKKSAYPSIHVRQQDHHLMGIHWPGKGYAYGRVMKFGMKRSAGMWECFGGLWRTLVLHLSEADNCTRWVDDCFSCCGRAEAAGIVEQILYLARRYNFTLDEDKFVACEVAKYTGIIFNSLDRSLSIPSIKLRKAHKVLTQLFKLKSWSEYQLQQILGILFHFTKILPHCRGYLSRLLACLKSMRSKRFTVSDWARADVNMWISILERWSGTSLSAVLAANHLQRPERRFVFDASPLCGIGILCLNTGDWISIALTKAQLDSTWVNKSHSSTALEAYALLAIVIHFPHLVKGIPFEATTDAKNLKDGVSKGYSTTKPTDDIMRMLAAMQCHLDCVAVVPQVPRRDNRMADALSKGDVPLFKRIAGELKQFVKPSPVAPRSAPAWLSRIGPSASL